MNECLVSMKAHRSMEPHNFHSSSLSEYSLKGSVDKCPRINRVIGLENIDMNWSSAQSYSRCEFGFKRETSAPNSSKLATESSLHLVGYHKIHEFILYRKHHRAHGAAWLAFLL